MARFSGFLRFLILLHLSFCFTGGHEVSVSAAEGQDCVLSCSGLREVQVSVLQWTRLLQDTDLLVYRAGKVMEGYEDPVYTNRVQLLDPQLTRGDLSVVLKEVTLEDSGTYRCLAVYKDGQKKQEISQFIRLTVTELKQDTLIWTNTETTLRRNRGLFSGLSFLTLVILSIALVSLKPCKRLKSALIRTFCPENTRDHRCHSVSSSSTTSSEMSDRSTKVLIHCDTHLPQTDCPIPCSPKPAPPGVYTV